MKGFAVRFALAITVCFFAIIMPFTVFADNQSSDYETIASGTCNHNCLWRIDQNYSETVLIISGNEGENEYSMGDWADGTTKKPWHQYSDQITKVIVGEGIKYIGDYSFSDCTNVEEVVLPQDLSIIKTSVFAGCTKLESVTLPLNLTEIGDFAFSNCTSLSDPAFPDTLTYIGNGAFSGCIGLKNVYLPDSVTYLGSAFTGCTELENARLPNNIKYIASSIFKDCSKLTTVNIPESVDRIYFEAFKNCTSLDVIEIPQSVKTIDHGVFYGAHINKLVIPSSIPNYSSVDSPYRNAWLNQLVLNGGYTPVANEILCEVIGFVDLSFINTSVIGDMKFSSSSNSNSLTSITITEEVRDVGSIIIIGVPNFHTISFHDQLENIESISINDCPNVNRFDIPACMTKIGTNMFKNCNNLRTVTIPSSVKTIGKDAFSGTNLQSINYLGSEQQWILIEKTYSGISNNVYVNFNAFDLIFDLNGGSGNAPFISVPIGTECIIPDYSLKAPSGKHFVYWTIFKDSYGDGYYPGDAITLNTNTLLYALWEDHNYGSWKTTKTATEIATGQKTRTCAHCGHVEKTTIAMLKPTLPAVTIKAPKAAKKAATVKWTKFSKAKQKKIGYFQIQYSTDKTFKKGVKTLTAKKTAASKKIKKLTSKKVYYFRIRSYLKSGGKVHISKWSKVKKVKAK